MNGIVECAIVPTDDIKVEQIKVEQINGVNPRVHGRRKKSEVWQHFTPLPVSEDCTRARCKQCNRSFAYINGKKQSGTSHLKRHISQGICPVSRLNKASNENTPCTTGSQGGAITARSRKRCRASPGSFPFALDEEHCIRVIAKMIILHDYPVNMVEHFSFINLARTLQPSISSISFDSVQSEIVSMYQREKNLLAHIVAEIPGRVSLTLDLWTSDQTFGCAILTGHFVDSDWKLQRRVLNAIMTPFPESEVAFNQPVMTCMSEWGLDSKLFALTLDQSNLHESVVGNLRGLLSVKNPHMLNGQYLVVHCYARVMSRLAQEALSSMREIVGKVRDSVKYVVTSESHGIFFNELRKQLRVPCMKNLVIDNRGRWDSTYLMLSTASEYNEVFSCLDTSDPDYKLAPTVDEWKCVKILCAYLKLFFDGANILLTKSYPAAHLFFHEVYKIQFELTNGAFSSDPYVSNFVKPLYEKFDKYWRDCCVVLALAVAMDPRYKLRVVHFSFAKLFGDESETWLETVDERIHDLYFEYVAQTLPLPSIHVEERFEEFLRAEYPLHDEAAPPLSDGLSNFDVYISGISSNPQTKSEIDQYLEEPLMPREDLDVFGWWKLNTKRYPTLSKMAADILSIPVATLHRDAVFYTSNKKLDSYRSSLRPGIPEANICLNDWLQYEMQPKPVLLDIMPPMFDVFNDLK